MTLIKLEDAVKAVQDNLAFSVKAHIIAALRSLPTDDGVTDEMVERAARVLALSNGYEPEDWREWVDDARAALEAALGPLPAPPSD